MDPLKNTLNNIIAIIEQKKDTFNEPTVEGGTMGVAIFYYFCHQYFNEDHFLDKAEEMVEKSINLISEISEKNEFVPRFTGDSISNVLASFGKGLLFIENRFDYDYDFSSYYEVLSDTLQTLADESIKQKDYDFFSGALSGAHFFLNKYYHSKGQDFVAAANLEKIYYSSKSAAVHYNEDEIYWTAPAYLNQAYLGLSHGSAMMINFWTKLYQLNLISGENEDEVRWLDKAVNFVFERKRNIVDGYFPNRFLTNEQAGKTQFAMCYGDLGILYSLYNANKTIQNTSYQNDIEAMLQTSSHRKVEPEYTYDAGILYGASGIAYIFEELFEDSGKQVYENTVKYWDDQVLTYRTPDNDFIYAFKDDKKNESAGYSFAWGISGMGIRLMQAQNKNLPSINELLLIGI